MIASVMSGKIYRIIIRSKCVTKLDYYTIFSVQSTKQIKGLGKCGCMSTFPVTYLHHSTWI